MWAQLAGPRHRVAEPLWALAGHRTVVSVEARRAGTIAAGPPVASTADTFPSHRIASPLNAGGTGRAAALPKGTKGTRFLTPVPQPTRVAALAVPSFRLTGLSKQTVGALPSAPLTKGSWRTWLIALRSVPARLAGLTVAGDWRARGIRLTVTTAFFALCPIAAGFARQLTEGSLEARRAGAVAGSNTALSSHTLTPATALWTPPALQAGATAGVLDAGRGMAVATEAAAVAPPARRAYAGSSGLVTARCWVALARATTGR